MTTIAWDGNTLSSDKRLNYSDCFSPVTKIFKARDCLIGACGDFDYCSQLLNWFISNGTELDFPSTNSDEVKATLIVINIKRDIFIYERTPYPYKCEGKIMSIGSGSNFALTAMYLGKTSREAVEIASLFDSFSGNGVDTLSF